MISHAPQNRQQHTLDGAPVDLEAFIRDNTAPDVEPLSSDEIARLRALAPGESMVLGGGAFGEFTIRRTR